MMELSRAHELVQLVAPPPPRSVGDLPEALCLLREKSLEAYYAPLDHWNRDAKICILGLTPGWQQARISFEQFLDLRQRGYSVPEARRDAKAAASFAGVMRTNLVAMLDRLGLPQELGLTSSSEIFGPARHLLHSTSALRYPVFRNRRNYSGTPRPTGKRSLRAMIEELLLPELEAVPDALVIPLGRGAEECVTYLSRNSGISSERLLTGFPHPSGANGHRVRTFEENRAHLESRLAAWFGG